MDGAKVAQVADAMQQALWALAAVVDGCAAAERDFLDCGGVAHVSKCAPLPTTIRHMFGLFSGCQIEQSRRQNLGYLVLGPPNIVAVGVDCWVLVV